MNEHHGCPHLDALLDLRPEELADPDLGWAELRARGGVVWVDRLDAFVVTDYDAAEEALTDHDRFLSGAGNPRGPVLDRRLTEVRAELAETSEEFRGLLEQMHPDWRRRHVLLAADGDEHTAHRRLVRGMFTARRAESLRPAVRAIAESVADDLPVGEPVELVEAYLNAVPMRVVADQLGIDQDHLSDFRRWATANNSTIGKEDFSHDLVVEATRSNVLFAEYFRHLMDERRADPRDDFTTRLVECDPEDGSFDDEIRLNLMSQMIGAGNDTTSKALADATLRLAGDADAAGLLRERPELVPAYMEEVVRLLAPTQGLFRTAAHDTELAGVPIPGGSAVLVSYASANRSETKFPLPDQVVLDRDVPHSHLAFSKGKHFCAGAPLARVLMTEAMLVLLERFGGWTVDEESGGARPNQSYLLHGLDKLWVRLQPARLPAGVTA